MIYEINRIICVTCKCVNPVMLSVMYFNHWLRIALSSQCITPVRAPLRPLTSNAFLLSLSVPNMYLVTYAIINGTENVIINYYVFTANARFTHLNCGCSIFSAREIKIHVIYIYI